jgi:elongation factor Ts
MANISASMVKELRDKTGAGMMDCKAALGETGGELEAAVDWLRKKGLAKAANFQGLVKMIANVALDVGADVQKIIAAPVGDRTIADAINETIAKVGENMTLRRAAGLSVGKGTVASYVHNSVADGLGRIGVIVALESAGDADELKAFGRMVAMHVASANPQAIDAAGLDAATIERERNVLAEKFKAQGKPANVIEKIVESGLKTFYKEVCLIDQPFIFDDKKSVAQALKESEGRAGAPIKIAGFVRYTLGEGIDRPSGDFGGEVAALAGAQ